MLCVHMQVRYRKKKCRAATTTKPAAANIADDVLSVIGLLDAHPFVQKVIMMKGKAPTVVLYTDQQIANMKRFCCGSGDGKMRSVLGVDRTFNLGPCFVTVVVYKCRAVTRNDSKQHPTFVGPMFLHWDGSCRTYVDFFTELRSSLADTVGSTEVRLGNDLVIGSDEEKGLTKALREVFSDSTHLLCVKHLRDNINDYMRNKCGVQQSVRNRLVAKIFDDGGLINAEDSVAFSQTAEKLATECDTVSATLGKHFRRHVEPVLRTYVFEPRQQHPWVNRRWNNNAAESINHLLKLSIEWHPRRLPELVDRLYKIVRIQMTDLRRSLYSHGNYTLAEPFRRFRVPIATWQTKTQQEKETLFREFLTFMPSDKSAKTVTSSNGVLTMPKTPAIATKPGQRKRPRAERARTQQ